MLVNAGADSELGERPGEPGSLISNIFEAIVQVLADAREVLGIRVFAEVNERFQDLVATITSFSIASKKAFSNLVDSLLQGCIGNGV
jgi:hypothetical protein